MISVLLIDDHDIVRSGLRLLLEQQPDIRVVGDVADAEAAISVLDALPVDVCVVDVTLGVGDGIGLADVIRRRWPPTRVVALTMHDDAATVRQALRSGASAYVVKGSRPEILLGAIRAAGAGRGYVDPAVATTVINDAVRGSTEIETLTPREQEVVRLLAAQRSTRDIAMTLGLSEHTVNRHVANAMHKVGARDRRELLERTSGRLVS